MYQPVEVVGINGRFLVGRCQAVGFAHGVGDERRVAIAFGHLPFVAGEDEEVVEVKVPGLKHTHHLNAYGRFAVEGDGDVGYHLSEQTGEQCGVDDEVAVFDERGYSLQEGVHPEYRLLCEWLSGVWFCFLLCCEVAPDELQQCSHPSQQVLLEGNVAWQEGEEHREAFVECQVFDWYRVSQLMACYFSEQFFL